MDEVRLPVIKSGVEPAVATSLQQVAVALDTVAKNTDKTAAAAEAQQGAFGRMGEKVKAVYGDLSTLVTSVVSLARGFADLTSEQARLDRLTASTGLNFQVASAQVGRYVSTLDLATAASRLNAVGLQTSQAQITALAQVAGSYASREGVSMREAVEKLTQGLAAGEMEGLRPFGRGLSSLAGDSHTAAERMAALVVEARQLPPAVSDMADQMARLDGEIERFKRETATGFAEGFLDSLDRANRATGNMTTNVDNASRSWREFGQQLGRVGAVALELGRTLSGLIGASMVMPYLASAMVPGATGDYARDRLRTASVHLEEDFARLSASWSALRGGGIVPLSRGEVNVTETPLGTMGEGSQYAGFTAPGQGVTDLRNLRAHLRPATHTGGPSAIDRAMTANAPAKAEAQRLMDETVAFLTEMRAGLEAKSSAQRAMDEAARAVMLQQRTEREANDNALESSAQAKDKDSGALARRRNLSQQLQQQFRDERTEAEKTAQSIATVFNAAGEAIVANVLAVVEGKKSLGEALEGMLSDILKSVSKEAGVRAAFEFAAALASAASFNFPAAGLHLAAGAAWVGVSALAGAGAAALAPSTPSAASAPSAPLSAGGRAAENSASGGPTVVNNYYNAPVIDGRSSTRAEVGTEMRRGYLDRDARRTQGARRAA